MKSHPDQKGFTLVELVVVLVVAGIVAAVAAERWDATDATAPYQAELLARNIRHMQELAMIWGQTLSLISTSNGYSVACAASTTGPCASNPVQDPASGSPFSVPLSYNVTLSGLTLYVDSLGRPLSGPGGTVLTAAQTFTLSTGSQTWSATVQPITGFVVVTTP